MISLKCPSCGLLLNIHDRFSGETGKCRGCGGQIIVPIVSTYFIAKTMDSVANNTEKSNIPTRQCPTCFIVGFDDGSARCDNCGGLFSNHNSSTIYVPFLERNTQNQTVKYTQENVLVKKAPIIYGFNGNGKTSDVGFGEILLMYVVGIIFPIIGIVCSIYLAVKGRRISGILLAALALFAWGFWMGVFEAEL